MLEPISGPSLHTAPQSANTPIARKASGGMGSDIASFGRGVIRGVGDVSGIHGPEIAGREAGVAIGGAAVAAAIDLVGKAVAARVSTKVQG